MVFSYKMLSSQICKLCEKSQTDEERRNFRLAKFLMGKVLNSIADAVFCQDSSYK